MSLCNFYLVVALAIKEITGTHRHIPVVISVFESCGFFGVVRVMFGIPKRVSLLCFQDLSDKNLFSLFCGEYIWGHI